jgi:hypothetical protein
MVQADGLGAERRVRGWRSVAEKRRIVELTLQPGASVALVAKAHDRHGCVTQRKSGCAGSVPSFAGITWRLIANFCNPKASQYLIEAVAAGIDPNVTPTPSTYTPADPTSTHSMLLIVVALKAGGPWRERKHRRPNRWRSGVSWSLHWL